MINELRAQPLGILAGALAVVGSVRILFPILIWLVIINQFARLCAVTLIRFLLGLPRVAWLLIELRIRGFVQKNSSSRGGRREFQQLSLSSVRAAVSTRIVLIKLKHLN